MFGINAISSHFYPLKPDQSTENPEMREQRHEVNNEYFNADASGMRMARVKEELLAVDAEEGRQRAMSSGRAVSRRRSSDVAALTVAWRRPTTNAKQRAATITDSRSTVKSSRCSALETRPLLPLTSGVERASSSTPCDSTATAALSAVEAAAFQLLLFA